MFSVGFEYPDPAVAARVANELMTRILNEDLRDRTSRATDTTKFLAREVQRLQAENTALDNKIAQLKVAQGKSVSSTKGDQPSMLDQMKTELAQKSALYSERHPLIQSLKRQIEGLEKEAPPTTGADANAAGNIDALTTQRRAAEKPRGCRGEACRREAWRESEKDQQSEKLEVIEQPTVPQDPIKPNRQRLRCWRSRLWRPVQALRF